MKKFLKLIIGVFLFALLLVLGINATDQKQTELTQRMLQKFPAQEGFSLKEFKTPPTGKVFMVDFERYSDYVKSPQKYDEMISKHQNTLDILERAFKVGQVAVDPEGGFLDGVFRYSSNDHQLFLASLSQKIKRGQLKEALDLLEDSNRFLASIVNSPQTLISGLISLAILNRNVEFVKNLKEEGVLTQVPASLKESFRLSVTPEKIWEQNTRREFQYISTVILGPMTDPDLFYTTNIDKSKVESPSIGDTFSNWFYSRLIRRNQTLNLISQGFADIESPACQTATSEECAQIYDKVTQFTATNFFVNPVGRNLARLLFPKIGTGTRVKISAATERLQKSVEGI